MRSTRIFLLSPAHCGGKRAGYLMNPAATFGLARQFHSRGAPLGEVFTFLSGLYFRGKLAYARAFSRAARGLGAAWIITSNRGLVAPETIITPADLAEFGCTDIDAEDPRYHRPLKRDLASILERAGSTSEFVLLGSIATGKYIDVISEGVGERLRIPADFAGRGDMSRGGLMLRCVDSQTELTYVPLEGAQRHGKRPARLERR
jgi:hypothetical protein